jgi:hypothetical protein
MAEPLRPAEQPAVTVDLSNARTALRGPTRLDYDPRSLGVAGQFVAIRIENAGTWRLPVGHLHAAFAATREGVAFPCNAHAAKLTGAIEPSELGPGQAFTFERLLDCTMPLPGHYDVQVQLHAGDRESADPREVRPSFFVGSFGVDVAAAEGSAPRPIPGHVGLYALMIGAPSAPPMTSDAWTKGGYRVTVVLVNGSDRPVTVGPARMAMLVFKRGESLPCTGRQENLDEPATLAPGSIHLARLPVSCAPASEGQYEIVGRLVLGAGPEVEIGHVGLLVTASPYFLFTPEWPPNR